MSALIQAARGASKFTSPDSYPTRALDQTGLTEPTFVSGPSWDDLIGQVSRMRNLEDDWDGQGAEAPHTSLIDAAIRLLQSLQRAKDCPAPNRVVAGVNGTVVLEWHTPLGYEEIEVVTPSTAEYRSINTDWEMLREGIVPVPPR